MEKQFDFSLQALVGLVDNSIQKDVEEKMRKLKVSFRRKLLSLEKAVYENSIEGIMKSFINSILHDAQYAVEYLLNAEERERKALASFTEAKAFYTTVFKEEYLPTAEELEEYKRQCGHSLRA